MRGMEYSAGERCSLYTGMNNPPLNIDDTTLRAYVDGELTLEQRVAVEASVAGSRFLAERVVALRASMLPYAAAFDRQAIPPVPQSLTDKVSDLVRMNSAPGPEEWVRVQGRAATSRVTTPRAPWRVAAAAFVAGVVLCAGGLRFVSRQSDAAAGWVQAVASYQELYARQTLANLVEDHALTERVVNDSHAAGLATVIPDLRAQGLAFKRAQRLSFHGQELIQLVYLPASGDPVALCMMREPGQDTAPQARKLGSMHAAVWRSGELGYVLVAKNTPIDVLAVSRQIAKGALPVLYGRDSHLS